MVEYRILKAGVQGVLGVSQEGLWEQVEDQPDFMTPHDALLWVLHAMSDAGFEPVEIWRDEGVKGEVVFEVLFGGEGNG